MSDPDADAVLATLSHPEAAGDSDAAQVLASFSAPSKPQVTDFSKDPNLFHGLAHGVMQTAGGLAHGVGTLVDVATGTSPGTGSHAERFAKPFEVAPDRLDIEDAASTAKAVNKVSSIYDKLFGTGPASQTVKERIPQAAEAISMLAPAKGAGIMTSAKAAPISAEEALAAITNSSAQSMGAAAATPRLAAVSPELKQAISTAAQRSGGAVNPDALVRHIEADTLPVPIKLTEGQATQHPATLSNEMNSRGQVKGLSDRFAEQNGQLKQNLQAVRDEVGPDVFSANPVEHGDTLIEAYKAKDAAIAADIRAKYQALEQANGGNFPVDGKMFVTQADAALKQKMKAPFLPSGVQSTLQSFRDGEPMTFENFENLRTTLGAEGRKAERAGDGNAAAAINLVREKLESLPMSKEAGQVKQLADEARSAAKARFDALRADPAYHAAVNDTVTPDKFVSRFLTGPSASRDAVALMRENLKDNPVALQTMGVSTLDHLRQSAGVDTMGNGNFTQAGYNKALQGLGPRIKSLVDPKTEETLDTLGNVARYTQAQPRGSFVNNSNTFVAHAAEGAKSMAEHAVNKVTLGVGGTAARDALSKRAARKAAEKSLAPGAGLDRLDLAE